MASMDVVDGNSPYKCTWCVKPFRYPSQLKEHIRVHTREKPYPCNFCDKAFSHSSALTQHERIHTGEKPFNCSWCSKSFSQSSNLKRHEKVHKGTPTPATANLKVAKVAKVARKSKQHPAALSRPKLGSVKLVGRLSPAKKAERFGGPQVKRNLSANMASVATGRNRMSASASARDFGKPHERLGHQLANMTTALNYAGIKEMVGNRSFDSKPSSSNSDRMYHPLSANPSARSAIGPRKFGLDENMDPVEMHRSMASRQAALGKSIEEYLSCGPTTVSPLMQDDASQFMLSKFMWSPSSVLSSPRGMSAMSMSTGSPTRSPVFMGAAQSVPVASSSGAGSSNTVMQMQQAYIQQAMQAAASIPVKMESPSSYQQQQHRINSHFRF